MLFPAFNAAPYVETAVRSVFAQSYENWELIAVDDASTDDTFEILSKFAGEHVRIERNDRNLGMTGNWNRCLALARGELVVKLDADDALRPHGLELLVSAFDEQRDIIAAGMRTLLCDEALEPFDGTKGDDVMLRRGVNPYADTVLSGERWYDICAEGHQLWTSTTLMLPRETLVALGGWDERFGCASDTELIWRVLEAGRPVAHRGTVGALYRIRKGSVSDEYRARGWLTWEGTAANLLSLSRVRAKRPLSRTLRMHYVRLWRRWHTSEKKLPDAIRAKLEDVVRQVPPPPLVDTLMTRARDAVSA